jgi:hypothetical protein
VGGGAESIFIFFRSFGFLAGCLWLPFRVFSLMPLFCIALALSVPHAGSRSLTDAATGADFSLSFPLAGAAQQLFLGLVLGVAVSLPAALAYLAGRWLGVLLTPGPPIALANLPAGRSARLVEMAIVLFACTAFTWDRIFPQALAALYSLPLPRRAAAPGFSISTLASLNEFFIAFSGTIWPAAFYLCLPAFAAGTAIVIIAALGSRLFTGVPAALTASIRMPVCLFLGALSLYALGSSSLPVAARGLERMLKLLSG